MSRFAIVAAAAVLVTASAASADLVAIGAMKDNTLYEDPAGGLSNGGGDNFFVGRTNQGSNSTRRGLMAFDVAAHVPVGASIDAVTLTLHLSSGNTTTQDVSLHRLLADWGEGASVAPGTGGSGTAAAPGDATWLHTFFDTDTWTTPGGDFAALASATATIGVLSGDPALDFYDWGSTAAMVGDVQSWLENPSANFGWLLLGNETIGGTSKRFDTREDPNADFRPMLLVQYTVPAPGAAVIFAGLLARRRRRP